MAPKLFTLFGGHVVRSSCYQNQNSPYRMGAGVCKSFNGHFIRNDPRAFTSFHARHSWRQRYWIGLVEGIGEATALIAKVFSGVVADRFGHKKRLVFAGYFLGVISKPVFALAGSMPVVLAACFFDRIGKGLEALRVMRLWPTSLMRAFAAQLTD